jgi:hypothetical protein
LVPSVLIQYLIIEPLRIGEFPFFRCATVRASKRLFLVSAAAAARYGNTRRDDTLAAHDNLAEFSVQNYVTFLLTSVEIGDIIRNKPMTDDQIKQAFEAISEEQLAKFIAEGINLDGEADDWRDYVPLALEIKEIAKRDLSD